MMPAQMVIVREPLVTALGVTIVAVDLDFVFDPDTCLYQFNGARLNRRGIKVLGAGINYFLAVGQLGATRLQECESPPNTCRKTITLGIQLSRSFSSTILGTVSARKLIVQLARDYPSDCAQACCP